jgi:hypothetical protein
MPHLQALETADLARAGLDEICPPGEQPAAGRRVGVTPAWECLLGSRHGQVHIVAATARHPADDLAGGRVDDVDGLAVARRDPLVADQLRVVDDQRAG